MFRGSLSAKRRRTGFIPDTGMQLQDTVDGWFDALLLLGWWRAPPKKERKKIIKIIGIIHDNWRSKHGFRKGDCLDLEERETDVTGGGSLLGGQPPARSACRPIPDAGLQCLYRVEIVLRPCSCLRSCGGQKNTTTGGANTVL